MSSSVRFRVPRELVELIRGLHPEIKTKIRNGFDAIRSAPQSGKALKRGLEGLRSFRVGRFRIVYRIGKKHTIEIIALGPRRAIYEETLRRVRAVRNE